MRHSIELVLDDGAPMPATQAEAFERSRQLRLRVVDILETVSDRDRGLWIFDSSGVPLGKLPPAAGTKG